MALSDSPITGRIDLEASTDAYRSFPFTICNLAGQPITGWSSGDVLAVQVWRGDDLAELDDTGVLITWLDAPTGVIRLVTDGTHALTTSTYQWRALATNGGRNYEIVRGNYSVLHAPGSGSNSIPASQKPYTTIDDLRSIAPWIEQAKSEFDQAGFVEQQIAARQWMDNVVARSWSNRSSVLYGSYYGSNIGNQFEAVPEWLTDVLASGKGIQITPAIKRACAAYACSQICLAQVSVKDDASTYRKKSAEFRNMAASLVATMTVRVRASVSSATFDVLINTNVSTRN